MQDRQVKVNAFAARQVNVQVRVDLAVVGQVDTDVAGTVQVRMFQKVQGQLFGSLLLLLKAQGASLAAQMLAKFSAGQGVRMRSEEHTSELQSRPHLVCRLLLEKKKTF